MSSQQQNQKIIYVTLLGGGLAEYEISIGNVNCDVEGCGRENVLGVNFEYSWMSWEICFQCLEKAKNDFQSKELQP